MGTGQEELERVSVSGILETMHLWKRLIADKHLLVLGILAALTVAALLSPVVLNTLHHYINFVGLGRSTTKVFGFFAWIFLVFLLPLLTFKLLKKPHEALFKRLLVAAIAISMIGNALSFIIAQKYNLPLKTITYAVDNAGSISFNHVAHTHLLKPAVGFLSYLLPGPDFGTPWFHALEKEFSLSPILLYGFYGAIFLFLTLFTIVTLLHANAYPKLPYKLLYAFATFSFLKSILDGGFLNPEALLSLAVIFILLGRPWRWYALGVLPFLVLDYRIWFTLDFILQNLVRVALLLGIFLFAFHTGAKTRVWKAIFLSLGILSLLAFGYFGNTVRFFDEGFEKQEVPTTLPAGKEIYFLTNGSTTPQKTVLEQEMPLADFLKERNVYFEYFNESIKINGVNCNIANKKIIFNQFRVLGEDLQSLPRQLSLEPWYEGRVGKAKDGNYFLGFRANTCLPDKLKTMLSFIKQLFPATEMVSVTL